MHCTFKHKWFSVIESGGGGGGSEAGDWGHAKKGGRGWHSLKVLESIQKQKIHPTHNNTQQWAKSICCYEQPSKNLPFLTLYEIRITNLWEKLTKE